MTQLFEPAFLERQQALHPDLDVHVYAALVVEFARRKSVLNPNGLLVHWLARANRNLRKNRADRHRQELEDLQRYAAFWVQLLRLTSERQLTPAQVAECISAARAGDYPKLNSALESQLRAAGEIWPTPPPPAPAPRVLPPRAAAERAAASRRGGR